MNSAYQKFLTHLLPTPSDIEGPFYLAGAPVIESGVIGLPEQFGDEILTVSGRVLVVVSGGVNPAKDAMLDIWQADKHGVYDEKGFKLRGKVKAVGSFAGYRFDTVMPGDYQIVDSPPDFRCAHIHVKVTAVGCKLLTTQLYFPDDKYNATDHWFDKRRVIQHPNGTFDFVLEKL